MLASFLTMLISHKATNKTADIPSDVNNIPTRSISIPHSPFLTLISHLNIIFYTHRKDNQFSTKRMQVRKQKIPKRSCYQDKTFLLIPQPIPQKKRTNIDALSKGFVFKSLV
jgi:hypothetical protein